MKTAGKKTRDARLETPRRRTNDGLAEVAAKVLEEVAAISRPHVMATDILRGRDTWHQARLRSIAAARIAALGFRTCHIARLFKQGWVTTHNQIVTAPRLAGRPMFRQYFQSSPDGAVRVDCGADSPYGICPECNLCHGYHISLVTATP